MRFVCISDTHGLHGAVEVPGGDVLLHAGDFSKRGRPAEVEAFGAWLAGLPHARKVIVAGNHDFLLQDDPDQGRALLGDVDYLDTDGVTIDGVHVWGSPWQPWFHDWAFNVPRGPELAAHWAKAPADVDVLITHTPPFGRLDRTWTGERVGCDDLEHALPRIAPKLHLFGHIHESAGVVPTAHGLAVNASICDRAYRPVQPPVVLDRAPDGTFEVV